MNTWFFLIMRSLSVLPALVAGIDAIHKGASGTTKKDLAMQSLGLAAGAALALDPNDQPIIDAAAETVSNAIDGVVKTFNAAGVLDHGGQPAKSPAPISPAVVAAVAAAGPPPGAPPVAPAPAVPSQPVPPVRSYHGE